MDGHFWWKHRGKEHPLEPYKTDRMWGCFQFMCVNLPPKLTCLEAWVDIGQNLSIYPLNYFVFLLIGTKWVYIRGRKVNSSHTHKRNMQILTLSALRIDYRGRDRVPLGMQAEMACSGRFLSEADAKLKSLQQRPQVSLWASVISILVGCSPPFSQSSPFYFTSDNI